MRRLYPISDGKERPAPGFSRIPFNEIELGKKYLPFIKKENPFLSTKWVLLL
jgi:hypothetical protein